MSYSYYKYNGPDKNSHYYKTAYSTRVSTSYYSNKSTQQSYKGRNNTDYYNSKDTINGTYKRNNANKYKATKLDANNAGIPSEFSIRYWDPTMKPIIVLSTVFDANSLGKWIYDWTVYLFKSDNSLIKTIGKMWIHLIRLDSRTTILNNSFKYIKNKNDRETFIDFIEASDRIWNKFNRIIKICEENTYKLIKAENNLSGKNAGTKFINQMVKEESQLLKIKEFINNINNWVFRFDANCEPILNKLK